MAPSIWTIPERNFLNAYRTRHKTPDEDGRIILLEAKIIPRFLVEFYGSAQPSESDDDEGEQDEEIEEEKESSVKQKIQTWFHHKSPLNQIDDDKRKLRGTQEEREVMTPYIELYRVAGETARKILVTTRALPDFVRRVNEVGKLENLSSERRKQYKKYVTDWLIIEAYHKDKSLTHSGGIDLDANSGHHSPEKGPSSRDAPAQKRKIQPSDDSVVVKKQKISSGVANTINATLRAENTSSPLQKPTLPPAPPHMPSTTILAAKLAPPGDSNRSRLIPSSRPVSGPSLGARSQCFPPDNDAPTAIMTSDHLKYKSLKNQPGSASMLQRLDDTIQPATTAKTIRQGAAGSNLNLKHSKRQKSNVLLDTTSAPTAWLDEQKRLERNSLEEVMARQEAAWAQVVAARVNSQLKEQRLASANRAATAPQSSDEPQSSIAAPYQAAEARTTGRKCSVHKQKVLATAPSSITKEPITPLTPQPEASTEPPIPEDSPNNDIQQDNITQLQEMDDKFEAMSSRLERMEEILLGVHDQLTKSAKKKKKKHNGASSSGQTREPSSAGGTIDTFSHQAPSSSTATARKAENNSGATPNAVATAMSKPLPSAPCQHPQASVHEFLRRILDSARPPIALYPAPSTRYKDMGTKTISRPPPTAHSMSADAMAIPDTSHLRPPVPPPLPASRRRNADNVTNKITPTLPPPPPPPTARQRIANPFSNR